MTLVEKQRMLVDKLAQIENAQERFAYVVEGGRRQPPLEAGFKTDAYRVEGCLANLWLISELREGKCYFRADADSQIVKAIAVLMCDFYSGYPPAEILAVDPAFLGQVGITQHLSANRRNALSRVWEKIRGFAQGHLNPSLPGTGAADSSSPTEKQR